MYAADTMEIRPVISETVLHSRAARSTELCLKFRSTSSSLSSVRLLNSESDLKKSFCNAALLVVNGCLDFFELEFMLSLARGEKNLLLACIAFEPLSQAGYESICLNEVPIVISGFCTENDISLCRVSSRNELYQKFAL